MHTVGTDSGVKRDNFDEGSALLYLFDPIFSLVSEFDESCLSSPREPRAQ